MKKQCLDLDLVQQNIPSEVIEQALAAFPAAQQVLAHCYTITWTDYITDRNVETLILSWAFDTGAQALSLSLVCKNWNRAFKTIRFWQYYIVRRLRETPNFSDLTPLGRSPNIIRTTHHCIQRVVRDKGIRHIIDGDWHIFKSPEGRENVRIFSFDKYAMECSLENGIVTVRRGIFAWNGTGAQSQGIMFTTRVSDMAQWQFDGCFDAGHPMYTKSNWCLVHRNPKTDTVIRVWGPKDPPPKKRRRGRPRKKEEDPFADQKGCAKRFHGRIERGNYWYEGQGILTQGLPFPSFHLLVLGFFENKKTGERFFYVDAKHNKLSMFEEFAKSKEN